MVDATIQTELTTYLGSLPVDQQRQVLEFAQTLATQPLKGVLGTDLLQFAGTLEKSEADAMSQAIAE
jgi:hypothetical protein